MTKLLNLLGLHIDQQSLANLWSKIFGIAGLVGGGLLNPAAVLHDGFGIVISEAANGRIKWWAVAIGVVVTYFTAQNTDRSSGQAGMTSPRSTNLPVVGLLLAALGGAALLMSACAPLSPKVLIDVADRSAYTTALALQTSVEADYQAHQPWPSFTERQKINILLGGDPKCEPSATVVCKKGIYDLIIDAANIGINLPPGSQLSAADLKVCSDLQQAVTDLMSIISTKAAQSTQDKATAFKTKAGALLAAVKGATQ